VPKENKNSATTRLPEDLKAELRKVQAPFLAKGLEAPSFGALLFDAWKASRVLASEDLRDLAEMLAGPETDEARTIKAQIKVALNEHRKRRQSKTETPHASKDHRREKLA
jgi:hypothetical protein